MYTQIITNLMELICIFPYHHKLQYDPKLIIKPQAQNSPTIHNLLSSLHTSHTPISETINQNITFIDLMSIKFSYPLPNIVSILNFFHPEPSRDYPHPKHKPTAYLCYSVDCTSFLCDRKLCCILMCLHSILVLSCHLKQ